MRKRDKCYCIIATTQQTVTEAAMTWQPTQAQQKDRLGCGTLAPCCSSSSTQRSKPFSELQERGEREKEKEEVRRRERGRRLRKRVEGIREKEEGRRKKWGSEGDGGKRREKG